MTCPHKITGALPAPSKASAFLARMAFALGLRSQVTQSQSGATSGPAQITGPKSNSAGNPNTRLLIERRALMLHNRNRDQAAKYLRVHLTLAKGACCDA
jgi:hypothetical protein